MKRSVLALAATTMALAFSFQAEVKSNVDFPITPEWAKTNYGNYDNCMNECLLQTGGEFIQCDIDCYTADQDAPSGSGGSGGTGSGGNGTGGGSGTGGDGG